MSDVNIKKVVTGEARLSYVNLLKPRAMQPGQDEKYSCTILIPKGDYTTKQKIDAAINAAIAEGVPTKWNGQRPAQPAIPLHDGDGVRPTDGEPYGEECKGHWVLTASSKDAPGVVDANVQPIMQATEIYSGMYANASVNFYPYFNSGKKGIGCGLNNVRKTRDGEPFAASRSTASSDFADFANAPAQPLYGQAPAYQQPQTQYNQAPAYQQPQTQYNQAQQIDPITGKPIVGGFYGV